MKLEGVDDEDDDNKNSVDHLYVLLNVGKTASTADIQRSYKQLSRVFHPDKSTPHHDKEQAQRAFLAIKQAHDVLSDPVFRLAYDCGGLLPVALIKRSQATAHSNNAREQQERDAASGRRTSSSSRSDRGGDGSGGGGDNDDEEDDYVGLDLYSELQNAPSLEAAQAIVQEAMDEFHLHQEQAARIHLSSTMEMAHNYGGTSGHLERESTSFQFQSRRQLGDYAVTVGANSQVQPTANTDVNASMGVNYQPNRGTNVMFDTMFNHRTLPQVSLRTSRQMASGTFFIVALAGNLQSLKTWNYSFISYRNILWPSISSWGDVASSSSSPSTAKPKLNKETKLQASWRIGLRLTGGVQNVMATLKTLHFPQWSCRLGLGAFPFKISYQIDEKDSPYVAYSWGAMYWRIKVAWIQSLGSKWTCKYGIKYDGRALFAGGTPYGIVCQLYSDEWTLRLPIGIYQDTSWAVASMLSVLLCQWIDQQLDWIGASSRAEREAWPFWMRDMNLANKKSTARQQQGPSPLYSEMIARTAAKKREIEDAADGLVIIRATWQERRVRDSSSKPSSSPLDRTALVDVTDVLQYWVVAGRLHLLQQEARWWRSSEADEDETTWSWNWRSLIGRRRPTQEPTTRRRHGGILMVRYRYGQQVFEICFGGDELIWLPNKRATVLGDADQVF